MSHISKFVAALVALLAMAIIASRQVFLSVVTRDPSGLSSGGGRSHLWLALGAGLIACIAASLMFRFFGLHQKIKSSRVKLTRTGPLLTALGGNPFINSPATVPFDSERWSLVSPWLSEGQRDDRIPMDGSVRDSIETPSGQRSSARRTHQLMFKKWSQERHD